MNLAAAGKGRSFFSSLAVLTAMVLLAALIAAATPASARQDPVVAVPAQASDVVPMPSSGPTASDWDGEVPLAGEPQPDRLLDLPASSESEVLAGDATQLELKFAHGSDVALTDGELVGNAAAEAQALVAATAGATVSPLFAEPTEVLRAQKRAAELATGEPQPDLALWFVVNVDDAVAGETLAAQLRTLPAVEMVQPSLALEATAPAAAASLPAVPAEEDRQYYLDAGGINAEYAWTLPGGSGSQVTIASIDSGFDLSHYDLDKASAPGVILPNQPGWDERHGTHVLGIIMGDNDNLGIRGIVSEAGIHTVNSGLSSSQSASAINIASATLVPGDVITISQGICANSSCNVVLPMVYSAAARDALRLATARGIIVVASAGNGGDSLDNYSGQLGADSPGTIVVGAGNPTAGAECSGSTPARGRVGSSNYGTRVDLQGWGACIYTTKPGNEFLWWGFTSGATPMVAGAAASLSSVAEVTRNINLTSDQVRRLLQHTGQPQAFGLGGNIGPLPNLAAATDNLWLIPNNDQTANAAVAASLPYTSNLQTQWAGVQVDEPSLTCGTVAHSVWYQITPTQSGLVTIDTTNSNYDTVLGLWQSSNGSLARVDCNNSVAPTRNQARMTPWLNAGSTYYVQVAGHNGSSGSLVFEMYRGRGLSDTCDINDDGFSDVVTGAPGEAIGPVPGAGQFVAAYGTSSGTVGSGTAIYQNVGGMWDVAENDDEFGTALACADFNGDGRADVAVGVPGEAIGGDASAGAVHVVLGTNGGVTGAGSLNYNQDLQGIANTAEPGDRFGASLATGDFNNDGFADLAIGAPTEGRSGIAEAGMVHILYGSSTGPSPTSNWEISQDDPNIYGNVEAGDRFGETLATGDINGDGYDDLVIGIPHEDLGNVVDGGAVTVVFGGGFGLVTSGSQTFFQSTAGVQGGAEAGDLFGAALAVGDTTGDAYAELVVGSPGEGIGSRSGAGAAHLFKGTSAGVTFAGDHLIYQGRNGLQGGPESGDAFAAALAIGDINGDGRGDLVIGAPSEGVNGKHDAGLIHVLLGSGSGLDYSTNVILHQDTADVPGSVETGDALGYAVRVLDLNGDGYAEVIAGAPGEGIGAAGEDAGVILVFGANSAGVQSVGAQVVTQNSLSVGGNETSDAFGTSFG